MTAPLLTTKFYTPPPHPNSVPHSRLIERLDEGVRLGHRLTLVLAPAGFGKAMLIASWIRHQKTIPPEEQPDGAEHFFAWLSLDDDNDPTRFFT